MLRAVWEIFRLPFYLKREKADVLFCPGGVVNTRTPANCRIVTMFRNMMPFDSEVMASLPMGWQRLRNRILRPVLLRSMTKADLVIFVSEFGKSVVSTLAPIKRSCVVRHGTSDAFRTAGKKISWPSEIDSNSRYILYVSRFLPYKNHMTVIKAYSRLPEDVRRTHKMVFVGRKEGREVEQVAAFIAANNLGDNAVMLDDVPHDSLPALYHHAEIIVFASTCENCPNILIEALGAGRPVLSSNVMPMPEIGGDAPGYFMPFAVDDLAQSIQRVLNDRSYANDLAMAAEKRSRCFDVKHSARETWTQILALGR